MLKKHKQTSDPLQRRSQLSYPSTKSQNILSGRAFTMQTGQLAPLRTSSTQNASAATGAAAGAAQGGPIGLVLEALQAINNTGGAILNTSTMFNKDVSQDSLATRTAISDAINQLPTTQGLYLKALDAFGDITGIHGDSIDETAALNAGNSKRQTRLRKAFEIIPGLNTIAGAFGKDTESAYDLDAFGKSIMASYSGVQDKLNTAKAISNKTVGFGLGKTDLDNTIAESNDMVNNINTLGKKSELAKRNDYSREIAQQTLNRFAGTNYPMHSVGKNGMKILSREELQKILATRKFQNGGVIGTDTNILPEGALHARLNHLQDSNPDLEDTTRKGIPVLDGEGNQVAEIENSELILRLEITKKIEELMKDGSEEAMIEAGKILVDEIIDNTQDNTGQITEEGV